MFAEAVRGPIGPQDLVRLAVLVSAEDDPENGVESTHAAFDSLSEGLSADFGNLSCEAQAKTLTQYLHGTAGFKGNSAAYYDPANSLIGTVLQRRLGIPLTLGLVYLEVARRHGVRFTPIGLPGHLVIRHAQDCNVYIDPFSGDVLTMHACLQRVLGCARAAMISDDMLSPMQARPFLQRMLTNLKYAYLQLEPPDVGRAFAACERILLLYPDVPDEIRDRGLFQLHLGNHLGALRDLERYLELQPTAADCPEVRHYVRLLYCAVSGLN